MLSLSSLAVLSYQPRVAALGHQSRPSPYSRPSIASSLNSVNAPAFAPMNLMAASSRLRHLPAFACADECQPEPKIESRLMDSEVVDAEGFNTEVVDAEVVDSEVIDAEFKDIKSTASEATDSSTQTKSSDEIKPKKSSFFLFNEASQLVKNHFDGMKNDLNALKDEQINRIQSKGNEDIDKTWNAIENVHDKIDETRKWIDSIDHAANINAPEFLKPQDKIDQAMFSAFQKSVFTIAQKLNVKPDEKPSLFLVDGKHSKLWSMAESAADEAEITASPRGVQHDIVVLDNLLDKKLSDIDKSLTLAAHSMKDDGFLIMINAHNPDRGHLNLQEHTADLFKGQLQRPLNQGIQQGLFFKKLSVIESSFDEGVHMLIAKKAGPLSSQIKETRNQAISQELNRAKNFLDLFKSQKNDEKSSKNID